MARFVWNDDAFDEIRTSVGMVAYLEAMGKKWITRLNAELKTAQARRGQPAEDGYEMHITTGGSRARLYIVAATARAQAHEAKHNSILKLMQTSGHDVKKGTGEFTNPGKGFLGANSIEVG